MHAHNDLTCILSDKQPRALFPHSCVLPPLVSAVGLRAPRRCPAPSRCLTCASGALPWVSMDHGVAGVMVAVTLVAAAALMSVAVAVTLAAAALMAVAVAVTVSLAAPVAVTRGTVRQKAAAVPLSVLASNRAMTVTR